MVGQVPLIDLVIDVLTNISGPLVHLSLPRRSYRGLPPGLFAWLQLLSVGRRIPPLRTDPPLLLHLPLRYDAHIPFQLLALRHALLMPHGLQGGPIQVQILLQELVQLEIQLLNVVVVIVLDPFLMLRYIRRMAIWNIKILLSQLPLRLLLLHLLLFELLLVELVVPPHFLFSLLNFTLLLLKIPHLLLLLNSLLLFLLFLPLGFFLFSQLLDSLLLLIFFYLFQCLLFL